MSPCTTWPAVQQKPASHILTVILASSVTSFKRLYDLTTRSIMAKIGKCIDVLENQQGGRQKLAELCTISLQAVGTTF